MFIFSVDKKKFYTKIKYHFQNDIRKLAFQSRTLTIMIEAFKK